MLLGVLIQLSLSFGIAFVNSDAPDDEARIFRLLDYAAAGSPGHGPIHLLIQSADALGFFWTLSKLVGFGLVFPSSYDDWAYSAFS